MRLMPITLPPADRKTCMISAFFWQITHRIVVIPCRPLRQGQIVCREKSVGISIISRVISQNSADLIYTSVEAWISWKLCVSAQYDPRMHLATPVANVLVFLPNLKSVWFGYYSCWGIFYIG